MSAVAKLEARLAEVGAEIAEAERQLDQALIHGGDTGAVRDYLRAAGRERAEKLAAIEAARGEAAAAAAAKVDAAAEEIVRAVVERARAEAAMLIVPAAP